MLPRRLSSNPLMQGEDDTFERDRIYVPLALVQRTKSDKFERSPFSPETGSRLYEPQYEEKQRFEHEAFLTQIIAQREGKTKQKQIALIGEAGAGKTTLLQTIAEWVLEKNLGFPVWISLADLGRNGSLEKIGLENETAIASLLRIIETTKFGYIFWIVAYILGKIDPGNETAIASYVRIIETTESDDIRWKAAANLGEIDPGNKTASAALLRIIETTESEYIRKRAAANLGEIDPGNETAIASLAQIIETTESDDIRRIAADSLGKIGLGNETAIASLLRIIETTESDDIRRIAADSLGKIGLGNEIAIASLAGIIETTESDDIRRIAAKSLGKIVQKEQMPSLVSALQHCLSDQVYQTNFDLYKNCHELIWECAQEMPYPEFYQAWHQMGKKTNVRH
ncbi:MAG TPA: hypothetical protein DCY88_14610 [Cyanobacteria bacterium UBA11372]|nr:hypothetical protein [Cyanobacteria bacterium UBA11372]